MLHSPRVLAVVDQLVAARMPQHVRVYREGKRCSLPCAGEHLTKAGRRHRRASLSDEYIPRLNGLAPEVAQSAQFPAPHWVDAGHAILDPPDVQEPVLEVDLVPAERAQLGDAQAVAVGDPDQGSIPVPVPVLPGGSDQALDFLGGQVLAGAALGMRNG